MELFNGVSIIVCCLYVCIIGSAIGVVVSKNLVYSVFYTIATTFFSTLILFLLKAEFLAIIYIIIYVGAIAILFLFVIMMMNVRVLELRESLMQYIPLSLGLISLLLYEIFYMVKNEFDIGYSNVGSLQEWTGVFRYELNMEVLAGLLYNNFVVSFFVSGLLLLLAMIGSIILTAYHEKKVLRQDVLTQVERTYSDAIKFVK